MLANVLNNAREHIPDLKNAEIGTIFLANLIYHLVPSKPYFKFGKADQTHHLADQNSALIALENIQKIAPNNPYVIFAHERIQELRVNPDSPFFNQDLFTGTTYEELRSIPFESPGENRYVVKFHSDFNADHHCNFIIVNQPTFGAQLTTFMQQIREDVDKIYQSKKQP